MNSRIAIPAQPPDKPAQASEYLTKPAHLQPPEMLANYVGGRWRPVDEVEAIDDVDPASGEHAALVPLGGARQVGEADEAARTVQPLWRDVPPQRRARALLELRGELLRRRQELVELGRADMGQTLADAGGGGGRGGGG